MILVFVVLHGVRFMGGTLWSDFMGGNQNCMNVLQQLYNDYRMILRTKHKIVEGLYEKILWTPNDAYEHHKETLAFLEHELTKPFDGSTIIVTHHAPSVQSVDPNYRNFQGGDASDLDEFVANNDIAFWFHGHIHSPKNYMIGNTRIVSNPRGYWPEGLVLDFQSNLIIEI